MEDVDNMEVDMDDLFGDGAGLSLPSRPPPSKELHQRIDELRGSGCCQGIAWSKWGSIASITSNGTGLELRNLRCHPENGVWGLSEPTVIPQLTNNLDGGPSLLIALATASKQLRIIRASIGWGFPQTQEKVNPMTTPLNVSFQIKPLTVKSLQAALSPSTCSMVQIRNDGKVRWKQLEYHLARYAAMIAALSLSCSTSVMMLINYDDILATAHGLAKSRDIVTMAANMKVQGQLLISFSTPLDDPEVISALAGSVRWVLDLMAWITDTLLELPSALPPTYP
ncbi:hypothetical protein DID88_003434 [Monilinia fructigena]|uniref:Uncharacterized protein n=1 Tax=Monilinia fructigena TaxID=38457 RepID=A0A395ITZ7_9HELO|nr:hypothetical protein DID88_003434 [Monilinia fructigena]